MQLSLVKEFVSPALSGQTLKTLPSTFSKCIGPVLHYAEKPVHPGRVRERPVIPINLFQLDVSSVFIMTYRFRVWVYEMEMFG